ncbi:MAG: EamA family transporter [Bacteroidales bacterium]|nr:EamA family transporter [Bacteroidales bacterium]
MKRGLLTGNLACFAAYVLFGVNIICSKNIAQDGHITPMALQCIRTYGTTLLFWLIDVPGRTTRRERLARKDILPMLAAAFLGLFFPYFAFLQAIPVISATDSAILLTLSPVMTLFLSVILLRERAGWAASGGVAISLAGTLLLTLFPLMHSPSSVSSGLAQSAPGGILLMLGNLLSFSLYLVLFRPLILRYPVVCFMKWMFLFSSLMTLPFAADAFARSDLPAVSAPIAAQLVYLVLSTLVTYFLIPVGQKYLRPVIVSVYTYLQPLTTMFLTFALGLAPLYPYQLLAALLVFTGVALVNFSKN